MLLISYSCCCRSVVSSSISSSDLCSIHGQRMWTTLRLILSLVVPVVVVAVVVVAVVVMAVIVITITFLF